MRDAIRDTISELAYVPILSEFGDIGYLPQLSAPDSCYTAARDCQIAILIIGKRYGEFSQGEISVTHREFHALRENSIPIFTLIDKEVSTFKRVYDANKANASTCVEFPGMDNPEKTFALIKEVSDSPVNNGFIEFEHVADARINLKKQIAHLFGNYLRGIAPTIKSDLKDVLSEIISLKNEIKTKTSSENDISLRIIRFLVEDKVRAYKDVLEFIFGSLENAVPVVAHALDFESVVEKAECRLEVVTGRINFQEIHATVPNYLFKASEGISWEIPGPPEEQGIASYALFRDRRIMVNQTALLGFQSVQKQVLHIAGEATLTKNPSEMGTGTQET